MLSILCPKLQLIYFVCINLPSWTSMWIESYNMWILCLTSSTNRIFSKFIHAACISLIFFFLLSFTLSSWMHFVYFFINWRTFRLFSSLRLSWIVLLWAFLCKSLGGHTFSFLLYVDIGREWDIGRSEILGHIVALCLTFWETMEWFSEVSVLLVYNLHPRI